MAFFGSIASTPIAGSPIASGAGYGSGGASALLVSIAAVLPGLVLAAQAEFDIDLPSYTQTQAGVPWRHGTRTDADAATTWQSAAARSTGVRLPWTHGAALQDSKRLSWRDGAVSRPSAVALPWRDGARLEDSKRLPWRDGAVSRPNAVALPWRDGASSRPSSVAIPWRDALAVAIERDLVWRDALGVAIERSLPWQDGRQVVVPHRLPWRDGELIETHGGWPFPPIVPPPDDEEPCYTPPPGGAVPLIFTQLWDGSTGLLFVCDNHPSTPPALVVVPIKRTYIVINDTHLIKLDGMIELDATNMQLSLDVDSWTFGFSANLPADQLSYIEPDEDGVPVMLAVVINGVSYYVLAESVARDRRFAKATILVSGRGKNAMLDAPNALTQSFGNSSARTAAQLLDDALTLNGVGIGWTVDFGLTDWLVSAGGWNHVGSHISAAQSVAGAVRGYLQPHPTDDTLRVLSRYPSAPWDWAALTPDFELPSSVANIEGITWIEKARYNRVYVSGTGQGKLCQVTRAGTAGDVIAPMVTDPLITHADAGRQRGLSVLADTGRIANVSLRLPVLPSTGIILPGNLVRYVDGATTRLGLSRSVSVEVVFPRVWQTIGIETHE